MNDIQPPSKKPILLATIASMLIAAAVLFVAVLPAEYGFDPLGTGEQLGLIGLSGSQVSALQQQPAKWRKDVIEF